MYLLRYCSTNQIWFKVLKLLQVTFVLLPKELSLNLWKICFFRYEKLKDQKEAEAKAQEEAKQKEEEDKSKTKWTLLDIFN